MSSMRRAGEAEKSGDEERLTDIEERATSLRRRRAELNSEAERWRSERDRLNESTRSLRAEALKHRTERDQVNHRVADIKQKIEFLHNEIEERRRRLDEIDNKLAENRKRLPPRRDLEEKVRRIEWELMTTPTAVMLDREEVLVEDARSLRRMLATYKELDTIEEEGMRMLADIKAKELEIRGYRDEMSRLRKKSQANHEKMVMLHRRADEERGRADDAHAHFIEQLSVIRRIDDELNEAIQEVRGLHERLRESERQAAAEREQIVEAKRVELIIEARRKLEAGEKLSLEELKLLYGDKEENEE